MVSILDYMMSSRLGWELASQILIKTLPELFPIIDHNNFGSIDVIASSVGFVLVHAIQLLKITKDQNATK